MILHLEDFLRDERPYWQELEGLLDKLEEDAAQALTLEEARRMHYLYQRTASGLAKVQTFAAEPALLRYLEELLSRTYGEIHTARRGGARLHPWRWLTRTFPQTFRRRWRAFAFALAVTLAGSAFGAGALLYDPGAKPVLMGGFTHLHGDPSERVAMEEAAKNDRLEGNKTNFSAMLMTHNTRVAITTLALGITYGAGSLALLFFNGTLLGAVCADYIRAGESTFLAGWLLPHGSIEIPAILIGGQAGFIIAGALLGARQRKPLRRRMREAAPDIVTLIFGVALLLVWAGIVEAFFSQYHEPVVPYAAKIAFGLIQLMALFIFLGLSGRKEAPPPEDPSHIT